MEEILGSGQDDGRGLDQCDGDERDGQELGAVRKAVYRIENVKTFKTVSEARRCRGIKKDGFIQTQMNSLALSGGVQKITGVKVRKS